MTKNKYMYNLQNFERGTGGDGVVLLHLVQRDVPRVENGAAGASSSKAQDHGGLFLVRVEVVVYNCFQIGVENSNDFFGFPKEESG
jgi:hypothetical protein